MNNHAFGLKVVDRYAEKIEPIIDAAIAQKLPIEVGFYHNEDESVNLIHDKLLGYNKINTHLNHHCHDLFTTDQNLHSIEHSINSVSQFGSQYSIIHVGSAPMSKRSEFKNQLMTHLINNLITLEKICEKADHNLYIENVFDDVEFNRELFERIKSTGLQRMHFCFDIGHARVWSTDQLNEWFKLTRELSHEQFNLHFHLHWNDGLFDQHLSLMEANAQGLMATDDNSQSMSYLDAIQHIHETYPESRKIFEVNPELALENFDMAIESLRSASLISAA